MEMAGSVTVFNISTAQIFSSARLQGRAFPNGCKLEVIAKVSESATGVEESSIADGVMFVEHPYRFHFTRSKVNFRPGWEYALKVLFSRFIANDQQGTRNISGCLYDAIYFNYCNIFTRHSSFFHRRGIILYDR